MTHRLLRATGALALVAAMSTGALATSASAAPALHESATVKAGPVTDNRVTFGIGPASARKLDGRPYFTWAATPGATLTDHVAVVNISNKPLVLTIYATDAVNGLDGSFSLLPRAARPTGAGAWIQLGLGTHGPTLRVPGRSTAVIPVRMVLPAKATPGDHAGGIIASLTSEAKDKNGHNIKLDQRVGTRVFIRVSGALHPALTVTDMHASYDGTLNPIGSGASKVTYVVRNSGNVNLAGRQSLKVHGLFGSTGHVTGLPALPLLLPGGAMRVTAQVAHVAPEVLMHAKVQINPVPLPGAVDPGLHPYTGSQEFWATPWTLLGLLVVCVVVATYAVRRLRRSPAGAHRRTVPVPARGTSG